MSVTLTKAGHDPTALATLHGALKDQEITDDPIMLFSHAVHTFALLHDSGLRIVDSSLVQQPT